MSKQKEQTWQQWARACGADPSSPSKLFKGALGALTGTDARVLDAFVACMKLYSYNGEGRGLEAARNVLLVMQPSTRWIAKELIAFVMDWPDRERLWPLLTFDKSFTSPEGDWLGGTNPIGRPHP